MKPGEAETFHNQVGYWLWEPAAETVTLTLAIPRGQVLLAGGPARPDATEFELTASVGSEIYGILSKPLSGQGLPHDQLPNACDHPSERHLGVR